MGLSGGKREHPRIAIQLGILFKQGVEWYPAIIKDLSEKGVAFETNMDVKPGDWCHIYFSESEEVRTTELNAEVVRVEVIEEDPAARYLVAVELVDANDDYLHDVQAIFQGNSQGDN